MAKQKVVIKLYMTDEKKRSKALKIVVGFKGVTSASIDSKDKDRIVVGGEGIDSVCLVIKLRKRMKYADLVSVGEEKKEEEKKKDEPKCCWPPGYPYPYVHTLQDDSAWCCIM